MRIVGFWPVVTCHGGARMFLGFLEPWWRSSRYSQWGRSATCACDSSTDIFWKFSVETPSPHGDWRAALWSYRLRTMFKWLFAFEGVVGGANRILRRLPSGGP